MDFPGFQIKNKRSNAVLISFELSRKNFCIYVRSKIEEFIVFHLSLSLSIFLIYGTTSHAQLDDLLIVASLSRIKTDLQSRSFLLSLSLQRVPIFIPRTSVALFPPVERKDIIPSSQFFPSLLSSYRLSLFSSIDQFDSSIHQFDLNRTFPREIISASFSNES